MWKWCGRRSAEVQSAIRLAHLPSENRMLLWHFEAATQWAVNLGELQVSAIIPFINRFRNNLLQICRCI